ncbi:MAG: Hpt domain-containing protein [Magnetococcales bacterium]|nr:Hpt domain-containing protein [Magnetococcales bacterium]
MSESDASDSTLLPETLAGINIAAGLAKAGGDRALYRKLLRVFHRSHGNSGIDLLVALQCGRWQMAHRLVHSIRGIAGSLGADALFSAAVALEEVIKKGDPVALVLDPGFPLTIFRNCLQEVMQAIAALHLDDSQRSRSAILPYQEGAEGVPIVPRLRRLVDLLESDVAEGLRQFERVKPLLAGTACAGEVAALEESLTLFELESAQQTLMRLIQVLDDGTIRREGDER